MGHSKDLLADFISFEQFCEDWFTYLRDFSEYGEKIQSESDFIKLVNPDVLLKFYSRYVENKQPHFELITKMNKGVPAVSITTPVLIENAIKEMREDPQSLLLNIVDANGELFGGMASLISLIEDDFVDLARKDSVPLPIAYFAAVRYEIVLFLAQLISRPDFFTKTIDSTGKLLESVVFESTGDRSRPKALIKFQKGTKITNLFSCASYSKLFWSQKYLPFDSILLESPAYFKELSSIYHLLSITLGNINQLFWSLYVGAGKVIKSIVEGDVKYIPDFSNCFLFLSVRPLAFFISAANTVGWDSCLSPRGDYFVGSILAALDNGSVVSGMVNEEGKKLFRSFDQIGFYLDEDEKDIEKVLFIRNKIYCKESSDKKNLINEPGSVFYVNYLFYNALHKTLIREIEESIEHCFGLLPVLETKKSPQYLAIFTYDSDSAYCDFPIANDNMSSPIEFLHQMDGLINDHYKELLTKDGNQIRIQNYLQDDSKKESGSRRIRRGYTRLLSSKDFQAFSTIDRGPLHYYFFHGFSSNGHNFEKPFLFCLSCGRELSETSDDRYHYRSSRGKALFCPACDSIYGECVCCGQLLAKKEMVYNSDDGFYCKECHDEHFVVCPSCRRSVDALSDLEGLITVANDEGQIKKCCTHCAGDYSQTYNKIFNREDDDDSEH